jgi:hypothetical protein
MVTLETVLDVVPIVSLVVVLTYYSLQVRNQNKTRQAQLFMQIYNRYMERDFQTAEQEMYSQWEWQGFDDFFAKYGGTANPRAYGMHTQAGAFYEAMGVLVYRGMIDVRLVDDLMSWSILSYWDKFGPVMVEVRDRFNIPQNYEYVEYLYNRIKSIAGEQHPELKA